MTASTNSTPLKYLTIDSKSALMTKCRTILPISHYSKR